MDNYGSFGHAFVLHPEGEHVKSMYQATCMRDSFLITFSQKHLHRIKDRLAKKNEQLNLRFLRDVTIFENSGIRFLKRFL